MDIKDNFQRPSTPTSRVKVTHKETYQSKNGCASQSNRDNDF